jgi:heat shock protein 1/8
MASNCKTAAEAKEAGNKHFAAGEFKEANAYFSRGLELEPSNHVFYSNRSASHLSLGNIAASIADAKDCIRVNSGWAKGYTRLGTALFRNKEYDAAIQAYKQGLKIEPANAQMKQSLAAAEEQIKAAKRAEIEAAVAHAKSKMENMEVKEETKLTPEEEKKAAEEKKINTTVIGIDLGTTYSCVGVWQNDSVEIIAMDDGSRTMPSYVAFTDDERLVGASAKNQAAANPANTVYDVKRFIGQRFSDAGVEKDTSRYSYVVKGDDDDKPVVHAQFKGTEHKFQAEEVSAMILAKLKSISEGFLGHEVRKAVITVPAYFNDAQRNATKAAGRIAGLEVLRIINEPTAAALAYGLDMAEKENKTSANVLVFDLGGGTFDVSLLTIDNGVFEVQATGGDTRLGGEDFDRNVAEFLAGEAKKKGMDVGTNARANKRLYVAAEKAKRTLSELTTTNIDVESLVDGKDFNCTLTRAKFESLNKEPFQRCLDTVKRVLKDAKMNVEDVSDIVLVGGSTRIPKIQEALREHFKGKALCKSINPDEAVAFGAAVQAAILSGNRHSATQSLLLVDVAPLSLGIETTGRVMSTIIKRNTSIPCMKSHIYTTEENFQTAVDIVVYEGERTCTDGNHLLGKFTITGIERAKRGEPQIEVTFNMDANGCLNVTAEDKKTGSKNHIEISGSGRASGEDVERMMAEAEKFKEEDAIRLKNIEARNALEGLCIHAADVARDMNDSALRETAQNVQEWIDNHPNSSHDVYESKQAKLERALAKV